MINLDFVNWYPINEWLGE